VSGETASRPQAGDLLSDDLLADELKDYLRTCALEYAPPGDGIYRSGSPVATER
jgi:hypothetical protein